ncbi:MAG: MBL fold metallo-hydrolase [Candidatus Thorarchaeota archaeon]
MTLERVTDRIYADTSGKNGGNYGAVILSNEIVFLDSGMFHHVTKDIADSLVADKKKPILKMLLTHYHSDHWAGAQGLGNVSIVSSSETRGLLAEQFSDPEYMSMMRDRAEQGKDERPDFWTAVQSLTPLLPDIVFNDEVTVGAEQDVKMWRVGGHTPGSSVVIVEPEHIMYCGDLIFNKSFPYAGDSGCDPDQWIAVLKEIESANYEKIIPGHGSICDNEVIREHINFFRELRDLVKDALEQGLTVDQFVEMGLTPDFYVDERSKHRIDSTAQRWFRFYKLDTGEN